MTEPEEPTRPPESRICHECGTTIAAGVEECPRCALAAELGSKGFEVDLEALVADLSQLEIMEEIGRGGMGVVFKAHQKSLGRDVALKILPKELDYDPNFSERFLRECRTLAGLSHQNVVAVYDAGTAGGHNYLLMELVDGSDLARLMKDGEIQPEQALSIVSQICEALQYAHDQGVVHRDIKPGNILIDRDGHVKLGDFGLAKLLQSRDSTRLTGTMQAMGTPQYMAPEQLERPLEVDHRADLYSLGVVLYELLTGELPLGRFEAPSKKAEIDVRLDEVVMKTLEKEPDRRYQSASEVRIEVERASSRQVGLAAAGETVPGTSAQVGKKGGLSREELTLLVLAVGGAEYLTCVVVMRFFQGLPPLAFFAIFLLVLGVQAFLCWRVVRSRMESKGERYARGLVLFVFATPLFLMSLALFIYFISGGLTPGVQEYMFFIVWSALSLILALVGWEMMRPARRRGAVSASEPKEEDRVSKASPVVQDMGKGDSGDDPVVPHQVRSLVEHALAEAKQNEPAGAEKVKVAVNIELEADKGEAGVDWDAFDEVVVRTTYKYQQAQVPFELE